MTRDDVVSFHARHVAPAEATLVVAGDLLGLDVVAEVEQALGGWATPSEFVAARSVAGGASSAEDRARVVVVDRPGSVQTEILVGCPGPDRHVEGGWAPYPVLGFVVGGSPTARIDAVLREEKGYTYGIRLGFRPRRKGGLFLTSGSVRADVTVESVDLLIDILDAARDGFTPEETRQRGRLHRQDRPGAVCHRGRHRRRGRGAGLRRADHRVHHRAQRRDPRHRPRAPRHGIPQVRRRAVDRRAGRRRQRFVDGVRGAWAGGGRHASCAH